jgi:hypothetical protein
LPIFTWFFGRKCSTSEVDLKSLDSQNQHFPELFKLNQDFRSFQWASLISFSLGVRALLGKGPNIFATCNKRYV